MVETRGLEPLTPALQRSSAPFTAVPLRLTPLANTHHRLAVLQFRRRLGYTMATRQKPCQRGDTGMPPAFQVCPVRFSGVHWRLLRGGESAGRLNGRWWTWANETANETVTEPTRGGAPSAWEW